MHHTPRKNRSITLEIDNQSQVTGTFDVRAVMLATDHEEYAVRTVAHAMGFRSKGENLMQLDPAICDYCLVA